MKNTVGKKFTEVPIPDGFDLAQKTELSLPGILGAGDDFSDRLRKLNVLFVGGGSRKRPGYLFLCATRNRLLQDCGSQGLSCGILVFPGDGSRCGRSIEGGIPGPNLQIDQPGNEGRVLQRSDSGYRSDGVEGGEPHHSRERQSHRGNFRRPARVVAEAPGTSRARSMRKPPFPTPRRLPTWTGRAPVWPVP